MLYGIWVLLVLVFSYLNTLTHIHPKTFSPIFLWRFNSRSIIIAPSRLKTRLGQLSAEKVARMPLQRGLWWVVSDAPQILKERGIIKAPLYSVEAIRQEGPVIWTIPLSLFCPMSRLNIIMTCQFIELKLFFFMSKSIWKSYKMLNIIHELWGLYNIQHQ